MSEDKISRAAVELLPCPFCGGPAEAKSLGGDLQNWACGCWSETCGVSPIAEVDYADVDGPSSYRSRDDSIAAWNIRSLPPSPVEGEGLREALSEAVYAIANSSGDTQRPSGRDFDYEDFCVWAEQWLPRARAALSPQSPTGEEE